VFSTANRQVNGGGNTFDCLPNDGVSKNVIIVGAVEEIPGGYTQSGDVVIFNRSNVGPTDDGRIKPDIVAKGVNVLSTHSSGNNMYSSASGTSMAAPGISGSIGLLNQHYKATHNNATMRSATTKALVIHAADEAGSSEGPDYKFGWGLMNTERAAEIITDDADDTGLHIRELSIKDGETIELRIWPTGNEPLKVTMAWTDPPATPLPPSLNPTTLMLINDLDIRVIEKSTGATYMPYVLNPSSPASAAIKADNFRDNVEQIFVQDLPAANCPHYVVRITHKGNLQDGKQDFSLIITGNESNIIFVKWDANGNNDGTSWDDAFVDLQDAIDVAVAGDEIWTARGTYYPSGNGSGRHSHFNLKNCVEIYGGFAGDENVHTFPKSHRNLVNNETILDGDNFRYHVVRTTPEIDNTAILDGFTIRGGKADCQYPDPCDDTEDERGGGMYNKGDPTVRNCRFTANYALTFGGGIYNDFANPVIINCTFNANDMPECGGGIANWGSNPVLINCLIHGNNANTGGGICNYEGSNPTVINNTISSNFASIFGGGIMNGHGTGSKGIYQNCIIWDNSVDLFPYCEGNQIFNGPGNPPIELFHTCISNGANDIVGPVIFHLGCITLDPLFINSVSAFMAPTALGDYRLFETSPAIDTANNAFVPPGIEVDIIWNHRIDKFSGIVDMGCYEHPQECLPPKNLTITNITSTSAVISWTPGSDETAWEVEYGFEGFVQGTGTMKAVSPNPVDTLTGLLPDTTYSFYVRAVCPSGVKSEWAGPESFKTKCDPAPIVSCPPNQSVCADVAPFALTGASPAGGRYIGRGVSAGTFSPAIAGVGKWNISYLYTDTITGCSDTCRFKITVHALPVVTCPANMVVPASHPPILLTGGNPAGGTYSGPGVTANIFDTPNMVPGLYTITYTYTDTTGCDAFCNFNIHVTDDIHDFGDAPDSAYPTTLANNAAYHHLDGMTYLGALIDAETDGQPSGNADGDDLSDADDEDGVYFLTPLERGQAASVEVWLGPGKDPDPLNEDWNSFDFTTNNWTFDPSSGNWHQAVAGNPAPSAIFFWSPLRTNYNYSLVSKTLDGLGMPNVMLKYDIFLQNFTAATLERMSVEVWNGSSWVTVIHHNNTSGHIPWTTFTHDITAHAQGHDFKIRFRANGVNSSEIDHWMIDNIRVYSEVAPSAVLNAWLDYSQSNAWADSGEHIIVDHTLVPGQNIINFTVPPDAAPGDTYARFRVNQGGGIPSDGYGGEGEVEDYKVSILYGNCDPPTAFSVIPGPTDADFTWTEPLPPAQVGYEFLLYESFSGNLVYSDILPPGSNSVNVIGLNPSTEYVAWIRTDCGYGFYSIFELLSFTTSPEPCYPVTNVSTLIGSTYLGLYWTPASPQPLYGYEVSLHDHNNTHIVTYGGISATEEGITIHSLTPNTTYNVYIRSLCAIPSSIEVHLNFTTLASANYDFGDAPENSPAYPWNGIMGQFPTCMNTGAAGSYIKHEDNPGLFFGPAVDYELEGNDGNCPAFNPNQYDMDECFQDGDAGLILPVPFTITGPLGNEQPVPCIPASPVSWKACRMAVWGVSVDIHVENQTASDAYFNLLVDWDQDGSWEGSSLCQGTSAAEEHAVVNFVIPPFFSGPISQLSPPDFRIGPQDGYVWARFSITETYVMLPWDGSGSFAYGETEDYLISVEYCYFTG
jgi:hypothetical protein